MDEQESLALALMSIRFPDPANRLRAAVTSSRNTSREYISDISDRESLLCECGMAHITGKPDKHNVFHAKSIGMSLDDIIPFRYTTAAWKNQYPVGEKFQVPTSSEIIGMGLRDDSISLPLITRKAPGRPKEGKRFKTWDEGRQGQRKNKVGRCTRCHKTGHNRATCKNVAVPNPHKKHRAAGQ
jgi:hypothetical protein